MSKTVVVAGAGVVGLSIARAAARCAGLDVIVIEANARVGMETSSRNSEVIHAGIYYRKGSLKARLCLQGKNMLYDFCDEFQVPHQRCGKLIVGQDQQFHSLDAIAKKASANGVSDLKVLSRVEAQRLEPEVECSMALYSPSTGIIDSHTFMQSLHGDAETNGAAFAFSTTVRGVRRSIGSSCLVVSATCTDSNEDVEVECDVFVNSTGIFSPHLVATDTSQVPTATPRVPRLFAKGTYFKLADNSRPFSHLVYPIPEVGGLGVHATVDMLGNVRFGPDVEWVPTLDYKPNQAKAAEFAARIQQYWPRVDEANLVADYCGIRPKIELNDGVHDDFFIQHQPTGKGCKIIHLCGIESPGLTSSLALGEEVLAIIRGS